MEIGEKSFVEWTEKVESISRVNNPLGIWFHLNIQVDYLPGITSVTDRIRYYTLLSWYYQNLREREIIIEKDFERLFILTCLSHHNGDYKFPALKHVFNIQRFKDNWDDLSEFDLRFPINGFARTYYNKQLDIFRCCWTDYLDNIHKSKINEKLSSCLPKVDINFFKNKKFTREQILENLPEFCICQKNANEIQVMTKLLFGFITHSEGGWDIDEESYTNFIDGEDIDFSFRGTEFDTEQVMTTNVPQYEELSQRRKNSLFMFLKIIYETTPNSSDFYKAVYDALYFRRNYYIKGKIDFGRLSKVVDLWELLQLNVYYVYSIEKVLDVIQNIVKNENGILRQEVFSSLKKEAIFHEISKKIDGEISEKTTLADIEELIKRKVLGESNLTYDVNESIIYDSLSGSDELEIILSNVLLMLFLLKKKFSSISEEIKKSARLYRQIDIEDKLFINNLFDYIDENRDLNIVLFFKNLIEWVIQRNLYESAIRFLHGTKNWLFIEEESRLFYSRRDLINIHTRDNRWDTVLSLMKDIGMIEGDKKYYPTEKGIEWLKKSNLI